MKYAIILFVLLVSPMGLCQTKYLIYFKDKGIAPGHTLSKVDPGYQAARKLLTERAIKRRQRVMGKDNFIRYEDIPIKTEYKEAIKNMGVTIQNSLRWFNAVSAYLTDRQKVRIEVLPFVEKVTPVKIIKFKNDQRFFIKSNLQKQSSVKGGPSYGPSYTEYALSGIPIVNSRGIDGKGVIVGILDNGFHWKDHESLVDSKVIAEYNFVFHDSSTALQPGDSPISGDHGTYVFSLIGGYKLGEIIGPAHGASFILAKTEDDRSESHIEEDNYAAALQWMESLGVDITTSSLGYNIFDDSTYSYTYKDMNGKTTIVTKAAELAFQRGVLTINAAGNEGNDSWHYIIAPADGFNTIAVGAVDADNQVAGFSSRGPTYDGRIKPDIVAMGSNNYGASTLGYNRYGYGSGTSFATPIASGIAAMLLSVYPNLTNIQARDILLKSSGNADKPNNDRGYGLVSAKSAISYPVLTKDSISGDYNLYKIFFSNNSIIPASVTLHYTTANKPEFVTGRTSFDGKLKYFYTFPQLTDGNLVSFYYTYSDSTGNNYRDPKNSFFNFTYGNWEIIDSTPDLLVPKNYTLSQNYPNPFNGYTTINFVSHSVNHARIIVFNLLGQQIKEIFNGETIVGVNKATWDSKYKNGTYCASGVYIYVLYMGGNLYADKMILNK